MNYILDSSNAAVTSVTFMGSTLAGPKGNVSFDGLPLGLVNGEIALKIMGTGGGSALPITPQGAAHGAVTAIPTGAGQAAGTASVATRATRVGALIQNYSTSAETLWFGYASGVTASNGVQLLAGQSCPIGNVSAIFFFSVAGTATGVVTEDYA